MGVKFITKRGRCHKGYRRVLKYRIDVPRVEDRHKLNELYLEIGQRCESFCTDELKDSLKDMEEGEYRYELSYVCTHDDGELLSLVMRARLVHRGDTVAETLRTQVWSLCDDEMIPMKQVIKRFGGRKNEPSVFLCDGEIKELTADIYGEFCQKRRFG